MGGAYVLAFAGRERGLSACQTEPGAYERAGAARTSSVRPTSSPTPNYRTSVVTYDLWAVGPSQCDAAGHGREGDEAGGADNAAPGDLRVLPART